MDKSTVRVSLLVLTVLVAAGCGANATPVPPSSPGATPGSTGAPGDPPGAIHAEAVDGPFRLVFELARDTWRAGEPIDGTARLEIATGGADLVGSGSGLILFGFRELDGRRQMGPGATADCRVYRLDAGSPLVSGITKSGGFAGEDPDVAFYRAFFADPLVRLPAGRWEIQAFAFYAVGECGNPEHSPRAPITITVEP